VRQALVSLAAVVTSTWVLVRRDVPADALAPLAIVCSRHVHLPDPGPPRRMLHIAGSWRSVLMAIVVAVAIGAVVVISAARAGAQVPFARS
jgi:hypothetical protein